MCGIVAINSREPQDGLPAVLEAMSGRLLHRGPDDHGSAVAENALGGAAHRRLSVIDLSARARQPLINEGGTLALVCNGEIYNHLALRDELERKGHVFSSNSDSEVILHLFEESGIEAVRRLRGMFAFAILNLETGELFCARDPLGKKPLYYAMSMQGVGLASEIPAFEGLRGMDWGLDPDAVALFLLRNLRHIPAPWTIYKSVRSVLPGHWMRIAKGEVAAQQPYWSPEFDVQGVSGEVLLETFDRAVIRRSIADVEVGALLSGGVDSTAIVDSLNRQGGGGMSTFAFGFDENDEEIARARFAANLLGTDHHEVYFDPERQLRLFDDLIVRHGQPIAALPLTHALMLFEAIEQAGLKVVMAGHGADEVFYGYDGAQALSQITRLSDALPLWKAPGLGKLLSALLPDGRVAEALRVLANRPGQRKTALYVQEARKLWPHVLSSPPDEALAQRWALPWFRHGAPEHYIDEAAFLGLMEENAHAVTIAGDLPAMAHGIEVRCPFLDQDLIEMSLRIPYTEKVGGADGTGGKKILKRVLERRLPKEILYARKRGFGYFVQEGDVLRGAWKKPVDAAFDALDDGGGILNAGAIRTLKSRFECGDKNVPPILIAKLYALQRFLAVGRIR